MKPPRLESPGISTVPSAISPAWHTAGVISLLLGVAAFSMHLATQSRTRLMRQPMHTYVIIIAAECLIVAFIKPNGWWQGVSMRDLVGEHSPRLRLIGRDFGLALMFLVAANSALGLTGYVLARFVHPATSEAIKDLLPRSRLEVAAFLVLAVTAGICEEIIFRGYLQRQFTAWARSALAGIVLQGIAFGLAHAYQGWSQAVLITGYGCMFGLLAHWRGSLRPCMMAHFLQDGVGGLLLAVFLNKTSFVTKPTVDPGPGLPGKTESWRSSSPGGPPTESCT